MTKPRSANVAAMAASLALLGGMALTGQVYAESQGVQMGNAAAEGKKIAYDRKKGNCLACHVMGDGASPGSIGPALVAMKERYPDKAKLRAQIYDSTTNNAATRMPPFGKYKILSDKDIDKIAEYVYTL